MPYLDVLGVVQSINKPWAVYSECEYAAIELMAEGLMNGPAAHVESWTALKRAGAPSSSVMVPAMPANGSMNA